MSDDYGFSSDGALPLETHQGGRMPGPVPRRGPTPATGGPRAPFRGGARRRVTTGYYITAGVVPTKLLTVLQLNAEGVSKKKIENHASLTTSGS